MTSNNHTWDEGATGLLPCTSCRTVKATPVVIRRGTVPPCSPDQRCPKGFSLGWHEVTTDPGGISASCLFCGKRWEPSSE